MPNTPVPLPSAEIWKEYPLVSVIVLCFALACVAVFFFTRWVWTEYCKEKDKDLAWRETQNMARERAVAEQNALWREAVAERDIRYERYDKERQGTLTQLAETMAGMVEQLQAHDSQAKEILRLSQDIDKNTQPSRSRRSQG